MLGPDFFDSPLWAFFRILGIPIIVIGAGILFQRSKKSPTSIAASFEESVRDQNAVLRREIADLRFRVKTRDGCEAETEPDIYFMNKVCECGHRIPDSDKFCPICGLMPLDNAAGYRSLADDLNWRTFEADNGITPELKALAAENGRLIKEAERLRVELEGERQAWFASDEAPGKTYRRSRVCPHGHKVPDLMCIVLPVA